MLTNDITQLVRDGWKVDEYGLNKREGGKFIFTDLESQYTIIEDGVIKAYEIKDGKIQVDKADRNDFPYFEKKGLGKYV